MSLFTPLLMAGQGRGKGKGRGKPDQDEGGPSHFRTEEVRAINEFYHPASGLPPGLAKRGDLPPGLEKQLRRNGTLPPGLQKKLTCLSQLTGLAADKPFRISGGVSKVSTTNGGYPESGWWRNQAAWSLAIRS